MLRSVSEQLGQSPATTRSDSRDTLGADHEETAVQFEPGSPLWIMALAFVGGIGRLVVQGLMAREGRQGEDGAHTAPEPPPAAGDTDPRAPAEPQYPRPPAGVPLDRASRPIFVPGQPELPRKPTVLL
jgi:hypothetical protein